MRDPHVETLTYRVETEPTLVFDNPPPVEHHIKAFTVRLADGLVTVEMHEHHASEESARRVVDEYLRGWEITAALQFGRSDMKFRFDRAAVIDRDPPPPGNHMRISARAFGTAEAFGTLTVRATRRQYPAPPADFILSPDVESMWRRFEGYLRGREPLPSMAYFCLTVVEASVKYEEGRSGGNLRKQLGARYRVHSDVLNTVGKLTALGDDSNARKKIAGSRPLTGEETAWLEAVIKSLIRRMGEWAADPNGKHRQLTMSDYPQL